MAHTNGILRKFDDPQLEQIPEYVYKALRGSRKKIRLLQLKSGAIDSSDIFCELVEADYDNDFHVPTYVDEKSNVDRSPEVDQTVQTNRAAPKRHQPKTLEEEFKMLEELEERELEYEALSWCWGKAAADYAVLIIERNLKHGEKTYKLRVREQLALALKYLRHRNKTRTLWIDAICIDQDNPTERNHQVQMMSRIYTRATEVCIWLGDADSSSEIAFDFIAKELVELRNFDALSNDSQYAEKWKALMIFMQREWFSRRWVVQELALANKATLHCGSKSMSWKEFAIAVELFVKVESTTHRISEIMQKNTNSQHVPGWFEYISALGASLLVQSTGKVFRAQRSPLEEEPKPGSETPGDRKKSLALRKERLRTLQTIDPLDRRSLLSLEYLVSTLFIFNTSEPRDAVYAMLALSRDATPLAISGLDNTVQDLYDDDARLIMMTCEHFMKEKPFIVDYRRPYTDVCKDFIDFAIQRSKKLDASQALDVLCRPWALEPRTGRSIRLPKISEHKKRKRIMKKRDLKDRPWKKVKSDSTVRGHKVEENDLEVDRRSMEEYREDCKPNESDARYLSLVDLYFPPRQSQAGDTTASEAQAEHISFPSWVSKASGAPIMLDFAPGIEPRIPGRSNADPLVGNPQDGHRNYSAALNQPLRSVKFRKRPRLQHYSLFVEGFVLDQVEEVLDASQGGNIPKTWLDMTNWTDYTKDPPSDLWRTLVADRGPNNLNPPYYYARACRESAVKGGIASGRIDTAALINNERNSIVAEFCRRVHSVIWNRRLFRTASGRLGLARYVEKGDKVCILYGCTVPVVLHETVKNPGDREREQQEDHVNSLRRVVKRMEQLRERKAQYQRRKETGYNKKDVHEISHYLRIANEMLREQSVQPTVLQNTANDTVSDDSQEDDEWRPEGSSRQGAASASLRQTESSKHQNLEQNSRQTENRAQIDSSRDRPAERSAGAADFVPGWLARRRTSFKVRQREAEKTDCEKWYEFRGDCYLHGMMDGEAMQEKWYEEIIDRTFELR